MQQEEHLLFLTNSNEIANFITEKMERGVTVFNGHGHFTKEHRDVLYCVVARNELVRLKSIINAVDPHAFVSVIDVHDVAVKALPLMTKNSL